MARALTILLSSVAGLAASALLASELHAARGTKPAELTEALVASAEAERFFRELVLLKAAGRTGPKLNAETLAQVDQFADEMLVRGEKVERWDSTGVDLDALLASQSTSGPVALVSETDVGTTAFVFGSIDPEAFLPAEWQPMESFGRVPEGSKRLVTEIGHASPKVIIVGQTAYQRRGNAVCQGQGAMKTFVSRGVPASDHDVFGYTVFPKLLEKIDRQTICFVLETTPAGTYVQRFFDQSGFRLPNMDEDPEEVRLMSLSDLKQKFGK